MPVSEKKLAANRKNAKKSTGPKTESGKTTSSRNGIIHGAYANDLIIQSPYLKEDPAEYERLLASLTAELKPETLFQECLVRKIANCLWRSRRVIAAETAQIVKSLDNLAFDMDEIDDKRELANKITKYEFTERSPEETDDLIAAVAKTRSVPDRDVSRHLLYYEMRVDRQLTRAYKLLKELKRFAQLAPAKNVTDPLPDPLPTNREPTDPESHPTPPQTEQTEPQREPSFNVPEANPPVACPPTT